MATATWPPWRLLIATNTLSGSGDLAARTLELDRRELSDKAVIAPISGYPPLTATLTATRLSCERSVADQHRPSERETNPSGRPGRPAWIYGPEGWGQRTGSPAGSEIDGNRRASAAYAEVGPVLRVAVDPVASRVVVSIVVSFVQVRGRSPGAAEARFRRGRTQLDVSNPPAAELESGRMRIRPSFLLSDQFSDYRPLIGPRQHTLTDAHCARRMQRGVPSVVGTKRSPPKLPMPVTSCTLVVSVRSCSHTGGLSGREDRSRFDLDEGLQRITTAKPGDSDDRGRGLVLTQNLHVGFPGAV